MVYIIIIYVFFFETGSGPDWPQTPNYLLSTTYTNFICELQLSKALKELNLYMVKNKNPSKVIIFNFLKIFENFILTFLLLLSFLQTLPYIPSHSSSNSWTLLSLVLAYMHRQRETDIGI